MSRALWCVTHLHPKLRNINLHNVTHSLISRNLREHMFLVQNSLLIVTFLSFLSWVLQLMHTVKEVNPHPHIASHVNMWSVFFLCHLMNCWCMDLSHCPGRPSGRLTHEDGSCVMLPYIFHVRICPIP
jgi:hypothetical protein